MKKFLILLTCLCLLACYGTMLCAYATEQDSTTEATETTTEETTTEETTTEEATTEQFTQTSIPTDASYLLINPAQGYAAASLYVNLPTEHNVTSISVYWGDAQGNRLANYAPLYTQTVTSNVILVSIGDNNTVPAQAKTALIYTYSQRFGECLTPYRIDLPSVTLPETGKVLAEFQVVSDLHIGLSDVASDRFVAMLSDVAKNSPNSLGIIAVGDLVDAADPEYYALVNSLYASVSGAPALWRGVGHHEYLTKGTYEYDADAHTSNLLSFLAETKLPNGKTPDKQYYSYTLGGQTFVFIGADSYENGNAVYSEQQLTWLDNTLKASDSQKPVFVFMHEPLPDTVSGSSYLQGYGHVYNFISVKNVLDKYSNAYVFSGHTHWTLEALNTVKSIPSGPTHFNCGAVASLWNDVGGSGYEVDGSQGYYVTVYEKAILVRGRDFVTGQWLPESNFLISTVQNKPIETEKQTTKAPTTTTKPADKDEPEEEEEKGISKEKLLLLGGAAGVVFLLAFVAVFGVQLPSNQNKS